jgi:predicted PurR-regulated permease PerM
MQPIRSLLPVNGTSQDTSIAARSQQKESSYQPEQSSGSERFEDVKPSMDRAEDWPYGPLTLSVTVLAGLAVIAALHLARPFLVPIVIGVLISYALEPLVAWLVAHGIPRSISASIIFVLMLSAVGLTAYGVRRQATDLVGTLPGAARELRRAIQEWRGTGPGALDQVQRAADELQQASMPNATGPARPIRRTPQESRPFDVAGYLWSTSAAAWRWVADGVVVVFLSYYLLLAGDLFRRRLFEIAGPTLTDKKRTLGILNGISEQISSFLFLRALISAIIAVATGFALWTAGLAQPAVWGLVAGVLNVIPYLGPIFVAGAVGIVGFLQFHSVTMALLILGLTSLIACVETYLITPWLTSRTAEMNPVAVFVGLAFWGWMWGLPGLLLAPPLMMILKVICEHVESMKPVAALLKA